MPLSLREIRRVFGEEYEISKGVLYIVKNICEEFEIWAVEEAKKQFKEYNHYRQIQGLPKLNRILPKTLNASELKLFNFVSSSKYGTEGQFNRDTSVRHKQQG